MRCLSFIFNLVLFSSFVAADAAVAEDLTELSIEELLKVEVISASRIGQKANLAPTSLSVLTASEIRTFGWRTLQDALNSIRGLYGSNDRNYSYMGVRGFLHTSDYNSRLLIMIDGQRMNENLYDGGYLAQEFLLDIDLIERIEFIPGAGSSIYGANAFSGLVNIVSKSGRGINGVQLAGEAGTFETYKGRVSYGKKFDNGADVLFSASHFDSAGPENLYFPGYDDPSTNNGIAHNMDTERADRLFTSLKYQNFSVMAGFVDRFKRVPTPASDGIFNDPDYTTDDRQFFGNLKYETALNDVTSLRLKSFYQGYDYSAVQSYVDQGRLIYHYQGNGRWWGGEAQLISTVFDKHRLMLGVEYQYDQRQRFLSYDIDPYKNYGETNFQGSRVELYAQDDIQILDDLIFSAGLRFDYHHLLNNLQLNPRLGLIWNPLDTTTFKLLYGSTFRAPNAYETDWNNYYNTNIHAEYIKSYEAIVEWRSGGLQLTGDVFYNDMYDLQKLLVTPGYGADGPIMNNGHYHAVGAELEAEQRWDNGRLLKASYTFSHVIDEMAGGVQAVGSPNNLFKLHYAEPLFDGFATLGIENIFVDQRKLPQGGFADAYNQLNLNLSSDRIMQGLDVSCGIYNVLDSHYQMLGGTGPADISEPVLRMNGREFRIKLQVTF